MIQTTLNPMPTIEEVLADPSSSTWLQDALKGALKRDAVDAANDAELVAVLLDARAKALLAKHHPAGTE